MYIVKSMYRITYCQLRARRGLMLFKDAPLRTRRMLSMYKVYGTSALLVLNGTLFDSVNTILAFSRRYAAKVDSYNWFNAFVICSWKLNSTGSKYLYSITFTVNFWFIQKLCWKHSIIVKHWMLVEAVLTVTVTVNFWFIQKLLCTVCWKQSITN